MHGSDRLPDVPPRVEPLGRRETHGAVVAADAVEEVLDGRDSARRPSTRHRRDRHPTTHSRVKTFNRALVVGGVEPAQRVNAVVCKKISYSE
jgi:hypothetical protein